MSNEHDRQHDTDAGVYQMYVRPLSRIHLLQHYFVLVILYGVVAAALLGLMYLMYGQSHPLVATPSIFAFSAIGMGVIFALLHGLVIMRNIFERIAAELQFTPIDPSDSYHKRADECLAALNEGLAHNYVVTLVVIPSTALNAFALANRHRQALIGVTEGLLSQATPTQLEGIIAHELMLIVSDSAYHTTVGTALLGAPLSAITRTINTIAARKYALDKRHPFYGEDSLSSRIWMSFWSAISAVLKPFYRLHIAGISRQRGLSADARAAELTNNPSGLSEGLYLISHRWSGGQIVDEHLTPLCIINPRRRSYDEQVGFIADLHTTHPPVERRIKILAAATRATVSSVRDRIELSETTITEGGGGDEWMVLASGHGWAGPFTIDALRTSGLITPETYVRPADCDDMIQAKDDPRFEACYAEGNVTVELTAFDCPHCREALAKHALDGVEALRCRFCQGTFVTNAKMRRLLSRGRKVFNEHIERLGKISLAASKRQRFQPAFGDFSYVLCPQCQRRMQQSAFSPTLYVMVDQCDRCDACWYDKDEVDVLQYLDHMANPDR